MGEWRDWWFVCERCGERQKTSLQYVDWDASPSDYGAADMNRSIEQSWACKVCGAREFQKDGRAMEDE